MIEQLSITTEAGSFDAIAAGPEDGRPVLLLHGFPEAAIAWEHQVGVLGANDYRAVAFDQRGYSPGVRPENPAEYNTSYLVQDVVDVADQLGWGTFDLVGHDWGGAVAWWTAIEHPDRLRTLTVASTPHPAAYKDALKNDQDQQMRSQYMYDWRDKSTERKFLDNNAEALRNMFEWRVRPSHVDEYVQRLQEPGAMTAALNWYRAGRPDGVADKVTTKTMYLWSTEDVAFGSTAAFETEKWVTGPYRFEMLEDVTHWIPEEVPEAVSALLLEHLC